MKDLIVFQNNEFGSVRTIKWENDEPLFCLSDLCKILELRAPDVKRRLDDDVVSTHSVRDSKGRKNLMTFVNEDGLYDVILDSRKANARAFRKWVTSEVLPQIRKTGGYIPVHEGDDEKSILAKALLICQKTIERQQTMIEAQQPDVLFANAVKASDGSILIGNLAKLIAKNGVDIGQNRLFHWMREKGFLGKAGRHRNVATQRYVEQGLFELEENTIETDSRTFIRITTLVTGSGQEYFVNGFVSGKFSLK